MKHQGSRASLTGSACSTPAGRPRDAPRTYEPMGSFVLTGASRSHSVFWLCSPDAARATWAAQSLSGRHGRPTSRLSGPVLHQAQSIRCSLLASINELERAGQRAGPLSSRSLGGDEPHSGRQWYSTSGADSGGGLTPKRTALKPCFS